MANIRPPVHAGKWYPEKKTDLESSIVALLANQPAHDSRSRTIKALIVPHAGYRYSGHIAAAAYAQIKGDDYDTVVVLGPRHGYNTHRISTVVAQTAYRTPLGDVAVCEWAHTRLLNVPGTYQLAVRDEEQEHAVELQLPLLQHVIGMGFGLDFDILPVYVSTTPETVQTTFAPELLSMLLLLYRQSRVLFVISTDFSHYGAHFKYTPVDAVSKDEDARAAISTLDTQRLVANRSNICGKEALLLFMEVAKLAQQEDQQLMVEPEFVSCGYSETREFGSYVAYSAAVVYESHARGQEVTKNK